jgi:hypothetical protein
MDIGEPRRIYTVEPVEDPVPREQPASPPDDVPAEKEREPEEVPTR